MAVSVQLTGLTTRPEVLLLDETQALSHQQRYGISEHQAYEYSERASAKHAV